MKSTPPPQNPDENLTIFSGLMHPKDAEWKANSVDPDNSEQIRRVFSDN